MNNDPMTAVFVFGALFLLYFGIVFVVQLNKNENRRRQIEVYDKKAKLYDCARFAAEVAGNVMVGPPREREMVFSCEFAITMTDGNMALGYYQVTNPHLWEDKVAFANDILRYIVEKRRIYTTVQERGNIL